jgi:hypothetical protein
MMLASRLAPSASATATAARRSAGRALRRQLGPEHQRGVRLFRRQASSGRVSPPGGLCLATTSSPCSAPSAARRNASSLVLGSESKACTVRPRSCVSSSGRISSPPRRSGTRTSRYPREGTASMA